MRITLISFCSFFIFFSCKDPGSEQPPDVSKIKSGLKIFRFENELYGLDTSNFMASLKKLCESHPAFSKIYFNSVIQIPLPDVQMDTAFALELKNYLYHASNLRIYDKIRQAIPGEEDIRKDFEQSLRYFIHYFPEVKPPVFYTAFCDFSYSNFIFEHESGTDGIGIGLEFFAGDQIDYKSIDPENPVFSDYLSRSFNAAHLLPRTWDAWLEDRIPVSAGGQLLDYIIQRGKKIYILEHLLPEVADTAIFEMSSLQLDWCKKNRMEIWAFFLSQQLLYSSELLKINKYINPSPNSPGMPEAAPGRTGSYIGYELVKSYMENNPNTQIVDLLNSTDNQVFLQKSRFKPRNE